VLHPLPAESEPRYPEMKGTQPQSLDPVKKGKSPKMMGPNEKPAQPEPENPRKWDPKGPKGQPLPKD